MPIGGTLKFIGFPPTEGDVVEARVLLPQGTPLARIEAIVRMLQGAAREFNEEFKEQQPMGQDLVRSTTVIFFKNPDTYESGPHVARVIVDLLGGESRAASLHDFRNR
jgi:HAE1 family hydrophobic/amphiphilic exporter-1